MQAVSQAWKDNQSNILVGESEIEISLKMTDPDAQRDATAEDNGHLYFANTDYIVSEIDKKISPYATLERNLWLLDGSREIIPNSGEGMTGYVGKDLCDNNRVFSANPFVTINFSYIHTALLQGLTINWSGFLNEYAEEFVVTAYNGETLVTQKIVTDNRGVLSMVEIEMSNYDRITIEILRWSNAHRRARIDEIYIGALKIFSQSSVFSYNASHAVDPISAELPKSEISFTISNIGGLYNPYNAQGLSKYLMERQEVNVRYGYKLDGKVEWISGGKYYLSEWSAKQGGMGADFKARDLLEFMNGTYYKDRYEDENLYQKAHRVLEDVNLPEHPEGLPQYVIDESLKNIYTSAALPLDTHANCLQMIANAARCVLYQDRDGVLHITKNVPKLTDTDYSITPFNSYSKSELTLAKPLARVDVSCYTYNVSETRTKLYAGTVRVDGVMDVVVKFSSPSAVLDPDADVFVSGGTVVSENWYSNAGVLTIATENPEDIRIVVHGYPVDTTSSIVSVECGEEGEVVSVDNPLITSDSHAEEVGRWAADYLKNRMILSSSWRADPRLDALDVVENEHDYGSNKVLMTSVEYSYNGAIRGSGEGRVI